MAAGVRLFRERRLARVRGYHRALCVYSHVHRGTPERPGLVLGLDRGGSCRGVAFRVAAADAAETIAYLRAREQVTMVYRERRVGLSLDDGRPVPAITYVVDRAHAQYAGRLDDEETLRIVLQGVGVSRREPRTTSSRPTPISSRSACATRISPASPRRWSASARAPG